MTTFHSEIVAERLRDMGLDDLVKEPSDRLRRLAEDWDRCDSIPDPALRDEMRRAVVVEMKQQVRMLDALCREAERRSSSIWRRS